MGLLALFGLVAGPGAGRNPFSIFPPDSLRSYGVYDMRDAG